MITDQIVNWTESLIKCPSWLSVPCCAAWLVIINFLVAYALNSHKVFKSTMHAFRVLIEAPRVQMNHKLLLVRWYRSLQGHIWLKGQKASNLPNSFQL